MKNLANALLALALVGLGVAAPAIGNDVLERYRLLLISLGGLSLAYRVLRLTYYRSGTRWPGGRHEPRPFHLGLLDYVKAAVSWLDAFTRTYAVEPGLYYTGDHHDVRAPLLVTSNYRLTVFLVVRHARRFNARILVVDTDAINVWCAAGKGAFSNEAIEEQLARYDRALLTDRSWLPLVLPKVGFAGVALRELRKQKIRPIIGPLYAKGLPAFLAGTKLRDQVEDTVHFGLQSRLFSWLPGLVQAVHWSLLLAMMMMVLELTLGVRAPFEIVGIAALLATAYPLLFPLLPGKRFAVKGLSLAAAISVGIGAIAAAGGVTPEGALAATLFVFGAALLFALSFTGNSAVSNYSRVRAEVARFFPLQLLFLAASLAVFLVTEVSR